jgi:hypothetical protein
MYVKIQSFWTDDCTFPEAFDSGYIVAVNDMEEAVKEAFKDIKPQIKPYVEREEDMEGNVYLRYYPTPSKNKTSYCESIKISESTKEDYESQSWVKASI